MKRCVCIVSIRLSQQYLEIKHDDNKITPYQFQSLCSLFRGNVKPRIFGIGFVWPIYAVTTWSLRYLQTAPKHALSAFQFCIIVLLNIYGELRVATYNSKSFKCRCLLFFVSFFFFLCPFFSLVSIFSLFLVFFFFVFPSFFFLSFFSCVWGSVTCKDSYVRYQTVGGYQGKR